MLCVRRRSVRDSHARGHSAQFPAAGIRPRAVQQERHGLASRRAIAYSLRSGILGSSEPPDCFYPGSRFAGQTPADIGEEASAP